MKAATVYLRFPFPRNGFKDPVVHLSTMTTQQTKQLVELLVSEDGVDWPHLAQSFHVTVPYLLQYSCHIYERICRLAALSPTQKDRYLAKLRSEASRDMILESLELGQDQAGADGSSGIASGPLSGVTSGPPSLTRSHDSKSRLLEPPSDDEAVFASVDDSRDQDTRETPHMFSSVDLEGVSASALEEAILSALND